jgi:hypothetical protein
MTPAARWWTVRRASSTKPATYRCPFCGLHLAAMSEHMLIKPEGDSQRRRHAHTACVLKERRAQRLLTRDEWLKTQPRHPSRLQRLFDRLKRR